MSPLLLITAAVLLIVTKAFPIVSECTCANNEPQITNIAFNTALVQPSFEAVGNTGFDEFNSQRALFANVAMQTAGIDCSLVPQMETVFVCDCYTDGDSPPSMYIVAHNGNVDPVEEHPSIDNLRVESTFTSDALLSEMPPSCRPTVDEGLGGLGTRARTEMLSRISARRHAKKKLSH